MAYAIASMSIAAKDHGTDHGKLGVTKPVLEDVTGKTGRIFKLMIAFYHALFV